MEKSGLYWGEVAGNGGATGDEGQPSPELHPHPHYIYIYMHIHIYLAGSGLNCGTRELRCDMWA